MSKSTDSLIPSASLSLNEEPSLILVVRPSLTEVVKASLVERRSVIGKLITPVISC